MSRIDWDAMLVGLTDQRTALEVELADVDAVIHAVRQRSAPKGSIASIQRPRANGTKRKPVAKAAPAGKTKRQGLSDDQLVTLKTQYADGTPANQIAARLKITKALLYYYVKTRGFKRKEKQKPGPKTGAAAVPAAAAPTERMGEKLAGKVRCTSCDLWTEYDPCENCGKKLKRNWS